jgi:hypothetical protein
MSQININLTPEFEESLLKFMRIRRIKNKSDAIRIAIKEGVEWEMKSQNKTDFSRWLGLGRKAPENIKKKFRSHDDLWR